MIGLCCASNAQRLLLHLIWFPDDVVRCALDDAASLGKLSPYTHEIDIDITGRLPALVDTPRKVLVRSSRRRNKVTYQTIKL